ncbi:MAG: protein-methionine-sulfoxide reductase heme-binding subunit MsrQ [Aeromonas sp.]
MVLNWAPHKARLAQGLHGLVHVGSAAALLWLGWALPAGYLGGDPVPELIAYLGTGALNLLLLTLCVSPLVRVLRWGALIKLRRPLGLWCFAWALLHSAAWVWLDQGLAWGALSRELLSRGYLLVGLVAWLILLALAITSLPALMRRLGPRWQKLHNWVYAVALLAPLHYAWGVKSGLWLPAWYALAALGLLWLRRERLLKPWRR